MRWGRNKIFTLLGVVAALFAIAIAGVWNIRSPRRSNREAYWTEPGREVIRRFTANPPSIQVGECSTLQWSTEGAEQIRIDPGIGPVAPLGSQRVCPNTVGRTLYRITCIQGPRVVTGYAEIVAARLGKAYTEVPDFLSSLPQHIAVPLNKELDQLYPGRINHNIPERMKQGAETRVAARIIALRSETQEATAQADQRIAKSFGQGASPGEAIQVSITMKAELRAFEEDFRIEPQSSEEQIVDSVAPAEWVWGVTPKKSGRHRLRLTAIAVVKLEGAEKSKELPVFDKEVPVEISYAYLVKENWKEIGAAISSTGILGWIAARFQKRRKERKKTPRAKAARQ
jgi:hypothetical protein